MNVVITVKHILFCFRLEGFLKLSNYKTVSSSNDDPPPLLAPALSYTVAVRCESKMLGQRG